MSHNNPFVIKRKQYFSMRQVVFAVDIINDDDNLYNNVLKLTIRCEPGKKHELSRVYTNDSNNKIYQFNPRDSPVTIGRNNCTINLNYSFLSKRHCVLSYNEHNKSWEIYDGYKGRPSTNGTWLTVNSKYEINHDIDLKIGNNIVRINMVN